MTTVAWDGKTLASESRATRGHEIAPWAEQKLFVREGKVYASAGEGNLTEPLMTWHAAGGDIDKAPKGDPETGWTLLVIGHDGAYIYTSSSPYPYKITSPYAMGSGKQFALGALHAGKSAKEAVEIACRLDVWSGGEIQVVDIAEALGRPALRAVAS
jgi:hypothetical protein